MKKLALTFAIIAFFAFGVANIQTVVAQSSNVEMVKQDDDKKKDDDKKDKKTKKGECTEKKSSCCSKETKCDKDVKKTCDETKSPEKK
ncbi:MAG: hypothetical protein KKD74_10085 [Bacteroidetes bacterium]|nr:hypothetical protein [Bacteroidales bacterium]MBU1010474.1 hypothetical protein [Bacteroidota bacterium]